MAGRRAVAGEGRCPGPDCPAPSAQPHQQTGDGRGPGGQGPHLLHGPRLGGATQTEGRVYS